MMSWWLPGITFGQLTHFARCDLWRLAEIKLFQRFQTWQLGFPHAPLDHVPLTFSPEMVKTYSHIRRQALNQAAAALEPNFPAKPAAAEMIN